MVEEKQVRQKTREGVVISNKMAKTVTVRVSRTVRHPHFQKAISRNKKYYAHAEEPIEVGKKVKIIETRPLSKMKRWRVLEVLTEPTKGQS